MHVLRVTVLLTSTSLLSACIFGGPPKCETDGRYQLSQAGERIEAPDGLDDLQPYKEMTIPEASPRQPRADSDRCLEAPPSISSDSIS